MTPDGTRTAPLIDPKAAVLRHLAEAFDRWAETEQILTLEGRDVEAAGAHGYAYLVLRAWRAESDDPEFVT